jgi:phosphoserine phosphatase
VNDPVPTLLPSWRPGPARERIEEFLHRVLELPVEDRLACFDNDGTLWVERPAYLQWNFLVDALGRRVEADPSLSEQEEYAAVLSGDRARLDALGLARVGVALNALFTGDAPESYSAAVREFLRAQPGPQPYGGIVYRPMLELVDALRSRDVTVAIVTGGGTEFVRAVSREAYGVPPELVVGTAIEHEVARDVDGVPYLRRTATLSHAGANEGDAKLTAIWKHLGRRPVLAVGNSGGDVPMLEWAAASPGGLALLLDHDDAEREHAYASVSGTLDDTEPVLDIAARHRWTVVSMQRDWATVFG